MLQAQVLDQATFDRLFVVETAKRLKANAEELVRGLLGELGMVGDDLENAMQTLFDTETKVSASKDYERRIKEVDDNTRALLAQAVKRVEPALKFG
jgi:primosomal protein N''